MSNSEIKIRLEKLEEICKNLLQLQAEFQPLQTEVKKLIEVVQPEVSALQQFRVKHQYDVSTFNKEMQDFRDYLKQQELSSTPTLSQVLQSLSSELMTSRAATSQALEVFTRLTETTINKISAIPDASFFSFFDTWISFLRYRENRGTLSFSSLLRQSPAVMSIYLIRARKSNQSFTFTSDLSDDACFTEILTTVFYPDGITVDAFKQLIQAKRMLGAFSIQKAAALSIHVFSIIQALNGHLPPHHVTACWTQTAHAVQDNGFRYSLLTQNPLNYESFWSTIDNRARIYSENFRESLNSYSPVPVPDTTSSPQHSSNKYSPVRPSAPTQQSPLPSPPPSHRIPASYSDQRSHKVNYVTTDWNNGPPVTNDQFCTHCNRFGVHREEYCPLLGHPADPDCFKYRTYAVHIDGGQDIPIEPNSDPMEDFTAIDNFDQN